MTCYQHLHDVSTSIMRMLDSVPAQENSAVVYDVDNTLIDDRGYPIHPIIRTYHYAIQRGFTPMIVTARAGTPDNIEATRKQLHYYGITGYKNMYFRPANKWDQHRFKLLSRKNIHERGHVVVLSVGDMPWDIGEYGGVGFRVPTCSVNMIPEYFQN